MSDTPKSPEVEDLIRYDILAQEALRGVVKKVLQEVARTGLPGDHHFYITFRTKAPGVKIPDHLIEQFPDEMTIVVQHQYWDLEVFDGHFEIVLKFNRVPQHLSIPYVALTRFVDPAVNFGVSFEKPGASEENGVVAPALDSGEPEAPTDEAAPDGSGETVVNLDAFRRK